MCFHSKSIYSNEKIKLEELFSMTSQDAQIKKANRKSAVERLEESKANYVKTERVLDSKQEFGHSSTLHVSTRPEIDVLLRAPIKNYYNTPNALQSSHNINQFENVNDSSLMKRNALRSCNIFDTKSQKSDPQLTNKKLFSRSYEYSGVQHPDREKRFKTASSIPSQACDVSRELGNKSLIACRNDFLPKSKVDFSPRYWELSTRTREKSIYVADSECLSNHEESEGEEQSTDDTRDSLSTGDTMEYEDKYHDTRTSDYVSRSSSFKCLVPSDRVRNLVNRFESHFNKNDEVQTPKYDAEEKRKSVSRSKSDVSHRLSKSFSLAQERKITNDTDLERFFNTMGLDTTAWKNLASPPRSPAHFFDSISSLNSDDHLSSICSECSGGEVAKEGLRNQDLQKHAPNETSIVEKNARVVKWLYNCYNARKASKS